MAGDADIEYLRTLLAASLDRATAVQDRHVELLSEHESSAGQLSEQLERGVAVLLDQQTALAEAQRSFGLLRQAEIDKGKDAAAAMRAAAKLEAQSVAAQISAAQRECAGAEQQHRARIAAREAERVAEDTEHQARLAQCDAEQQERLAAAEAGRAGQDGAHRAKLARREAELQQRLAAAEAQTAMREAEVAARLDRLEATHRAAIAEQCRVFEAGCADKEAAVVAAIAQRERAFAADCEGQRAALGKLAETEQAIQVRVAAIRQLASAEGPGRRVVLDVAGVQFTTTVAALTRCPHSVLAELWRQHQTGADAAPAPGGQATAAPGPVEVDGDPSQFHLIMTYLRRGRLPVVENIAQMQWLEAEAECGNFDFWISLDQSSRSSRRLATPHVPYIMPCCRVSGADLDADHLGAIRCCAPITNAVPDHRVQVLRARRARQAVPRCLQAA